MRACMYQYIHVFCIYVFHTDTPSFIIHVSWCIHQSSAIIHHYSSSCVASICRHFDLGPLVLIFILTAACLGHQKLLVQIRYRSDHGVGGVPSVYLPEWAGPSPPYGREAQTHQTLVVLRSVSWMRSLRASLRRSAPCRSKDSVGQHELHGAALG